MDIFKIALTPPLLGSWTPTRNFAKKMQKKIKCLKHFGFGLEPPPLDNAQIQADFFGGYLP